MKIFIILFFLLALVGNVFPQEKQKIPADFFGVGVKWCGTLDGIAWSGDTRISFTIEILGPVDCILHPFGLKGGILLAGRSRNGPYIPVIIDNKPFFDGTILHFMFDPGENPSNIILGLLGIFAEQPFFDDKVNLIENSVEVNNMWQRNETGCSVKGIIYKVNTQKLYFPKDIKPNEPIKTDKRTRIEVTLPNVGKVNIAENTQAVFNSENLLEIVKGKIHAIIDKLKPQTKFNVNTPTAIVGVRGTEYQIEVEDDGTTTLIVFDGEVEISDLDKKKTVIVKKNHKSIVKPGKLPSEPENINPEQILEWWK